MHLALILTYKKLDMPQSTISIRVDSSLKDKFDALCEAFGMTTTAAFNIFMKTVIRERRIPFEIRAENEDEIRKNALNILHQLRASAAGNGVSDLTLDDINSEIKKYRDDRDK